MLGFDNELDRIEFIIALTERANSDGSLDGQLERLLVEYISELTGVAYTEGDLYGERKKEPKKECKTDPEPIDDFLSDDDDRLWQ